MHSRAWARCHLLSISFLKIPLFAVSRSFHPWQWPCSPVLQLLLPFLHPSEETGLVPDLRRGRRNQQRPRDWHFLSQKNGSFLLAAFWVLEAAKICSKSILCHLLSSLICHTENSSISLSEEKIGKYLAPRKHSGMGESSLSQLPGKPKWILLKLRSIHNFEGEKRQDRGPRRMAVP